MAIYYFQGVKFNIVTLLSIPYITKLEPVDPLKSNYFDEFKMEGSFAEVWFHLQDILNFTYHLSKPADGQWGAIQPDGSWSGMVKSLQNKSADMGK